MGRAINRISHSAEETIAMGFELGKSLRPNTVICFFGDLGAGKTTFIKGVVAAVTGLSVDTVVSPTFVYMNTYEGAQNVYHFDLYRLRDGDEFLSMGFDEFFFAGGISCVEWSERIPELIPSCSITVSITHLNQKDRHIAIT